MAADDPYAGWTLTPGDGPGEWRLTDPDDPARVLYAYTRGARRFGCTGAAAHSTPWVSPKLGGRAREYALNRLDEMRRFRWSRYGRRFRPRGQDKVQEGRSVNLARRMELDNYTVSVTPGHIATGAPDGMPRSLCCPVALALNADTNCLWAVGRHDAWRRNGEASDGTRNFISLPGWMVDIIGDFDVWGLMEPFRFVLTWTSARWEMEPHTPGGHLRLIGGDTQ